MPIPYLHPNVLSALATGGMDAAEAVLDDCTRVVLLSAEAATYSDANTNLGTGSGRKIAEITVVSTDFAVSGTGQARKVTFAGKTGGTVTIAGPSDPTVIAFLDTSNSLILAQVAESGSATFSTGGSLTIPAFDLLAFGTLA